MSSPRRPNLTNAGRAILATDPDSNGSLGIAISEAVEDAATREDTRYALGSVLNHVCLHQTVIGLEAKEQLALVGDYPDVVIGCHGGGSNFAGIAFPFVADKAAGKNVRLLAVEPTSCPTLTKGVYAFDYGDTAKMAPIAKMYTLGHDFMPPGIHAGGLRYHGASPLVSQLVHAGVVEARAVGQIGCFEAAVLFSRAEGIIPAPESSHAIRGGHRRGAAGQGGGEGEDDSLQPLRPRSCRHGRLRRLLRGASSRISSIRAKRSGSRWHTCRRYRSRQNTGTGGQEWAKPVPFTG